MASGMSNFNIKKSFVWKYGFSKLHKKKNGDGADGCPQPDDESSGGSPEPDLDLQPHWEPLVPPGGAGWPPPPPPDPAIPDKRRSAAADEAAALPGYAVAGCRRVSAADAENPIYETLSEYGCPALAEDQRTLYENDDTDDELAGPLYENGPLQPVYANGSELEEEVPIYENLTAEEEAVVLRAATGLPRPFDDLRVEVRSDLGYDSYQSPSSGSSGSSECTPKLSPGSDGAHTESVDSEPEPAPAPAPAPAPEPEPEPRRPTPEVKTPALEVKGPAPGRGPRGSLTGLISAESLLSAKQALKQSRSLPVVRPVGVKKIRGEKVPSDLRGPSMDNEKQAYRKAQMTAGGDRLSSNKARPKSDLAGLKSAGVKESEHSSKRSSVSSMSHLHDRLNEKGNGHSQEAGLPKQNTSFLHRGRNSSKMGDNAGFQMARKAIAQALHMERPHEPTENKPNTTASTSLTPALRADLTSPVDRVAVPPSVIPPPPPPPPLPGQAAGGPPKLTPSAAKAPAPQALQTGLKKKLEARKSVMAAEKCPSKKKRMAPKPPDRSLSLPGFGSSKIDIAKAFEEFKQKEKKRERDELSKRQKCNFFGELDVKISKKRPSKSADQDGLMNAPQSLTVVESGLSFNSRKPESLENGASGTFHGVSKSLKDYSEEEAMPKLNPNRRSRECKSLRQIDRNTKETTKERLPSKTDIFPSDLFQQHAIEILRHGSSNEEPSVSPKESYENSRDSTEIMVLESVQPLRQKSHEIGVPNTDRRTYCPIAAECKTPSSSSANWTTSTAAAADCRITPAAAADCLVTVGGPQVIHISPEDSPPPLPRLAPISLTVTAEPGGRTSAPADCADRVAVQVTHAPPASLYHASVVAVDAAEAGADADADALARRVAALQSRVRSSGRLQSGQVDLVGPLVISVSEVERQFELLEQEHWCEDAFAGVDLRRKRTLPEAVRRQRAASEPPWDLAAKNSRPKSVEALSIIANKEKTKHFLASRIQADLDACDGSSPACDPARSSRMSLPSALCPPAGFGDVPAPAEGGRPAETDAERCRHPEVCAAAPETRIAREIREQQRREEELRRLRVTAAYGPPSPGRDEPLSGYGSEDKESLAEEADSGAQGGSPPAAASGRRQRSRSQESLSSGHSSGLGSDHTAEMAGRRRVTVRPYEDQEDEEQWASFSRSAETPIEREIRLTKEREEERRREQALRAPQAAVSSHNKRQPVRQGARPSGPERRPPTEPDRRQAALRLATGRVQHEIQEATRRELELRGEGKTITTSEETVDEKVTRLGDMAKQSAELTNGHHPKSEPSPRPATASARPAAAAAASATDGPASRAHPAAFRPQAASAGAGRGLMEKFISSRGRLRLASAFASPSPPAGRRDVHGPAPVGRGAPGPAGAVCRTPGPTAVGRGPPAASSQGQQRRQATRWSVDGAEPVGPRKSAETDRRAPAHPVHRRILTAEEKIQLELKLMKEREDELRRERTWALARSQPDLLAALVEPINQQESADPPPGQLTRTMSNPNLLEDQDDQMPGATANGRRRSVLIDQWESRIQGAEV